MRRADRQITDAEVISILESGEYGVLSTCTQDLVPYAVPLSYCLVKNNLYFHCALEGRKIDCVLANPKVSFCVVGKTALLPDKFATQYESVLVSGLAAEVFNEEKQTALEGLVHKYSKAFLAEGLAYIEKLTAKTRVFKIEMREVSGKARR